MNSAACATIPTVALAGQTWYRAIQPQHWSTALQTSHTVHFSSRFSSGRSARPPMQLLYCAQDPAVALFEVQALLGNPYGNFVPQPASAWVTINVTVNLQQVVDLSLPTWQAHISTDVQALTGDWIGYDVRRRSASLNVPVGSAPTQDLGAALHGLPNLEGFISVSAKVPDKRTLVVFPNKLLNGSSVTFFDPATGKRHSIP